MKLKSLAFLMLLSIPAFPSWGQTLLEGYGNDRLQVQEQGGHP